MRIAHLLPLLGIIGLAGCDAFVDAVDVPIDRVASDSLDTVGAVDFLITGVKEGFNDSYDALAVSADLLSDAAIFDRGVSNATFPSFDEIDDGDIPFDNNTVDGIYNAINEYRYLADELVRRANETIPFGEGDEDVRDRALFAGYLHGGIARYFLATYFGLEPTMGGGVISNDPDNPSPFIPSAELYDLSDERLETALELAPDAYDERLVYSLLARNALYAGDVMRAGELAAQGLQPEDPAYVGRYASTSQNNWYTQGGRARTQVVFADRFADYAATDPRVAVETAPTVRGETRTFYRQALYTTSDAPIPFISWEETALIQAEAALLDDGPGDALDLVNRVRAAVELDPLDALDQDALLEERDRELFTQGARLVDQRRFGLPFTNLDGPLDGPWRYLPITQSERNANPNF